LVLVDNANLSLYYLDVGGTLGHVDVSSAQIYRWDGQNWQALSSTSSQVEQMVSAVINGFGTYALMADRQEKVYLPLVIRQQVSLTTAIPGKPISFTAPQPPGERYF
jgi:hypothetical protein